MTERFATVALPLPLASSYSYRIPETLADRVTPGARVVVPVRRREMIGIVLEADAPAPETTNQPSDPPPDPDAPAPVTPLPVGVGGDDVLWRALRGENTKP